MVGQTGKTMAKTLEKLAQEAYLKNKEMHSNSSSPDSSGESTETTMSLESEESHSIRL